MQFPTRLKQLLNLPQPMLWRGGLLLLAGQLLVAVGLILFVPAIASQIWLWLPLVLIGLVLGAAARHAANQPTESRTWEWFVGGLVLMGAAIVYGAFALALGLGQPPNLADLLLPLAIGMLAYCLVRYPQPPRSDTTRLRLLLDLALTLGALAAIAYSTHFDQIATDIRNQPALAYWASVRQAFNWLLVLATAYLLLRVQPSAFRPAAGVLGLGLTLFGLSDAHLTYKLLHNLAPNPDIPLLLTRHLGLTLAITAPLVHLYSPLPNVLTPGQAAARWVYRLQLGLPLAAVLALFGFTLVTQFGLTQFNPGLLLLAITLSAILVVRQGVLFGEGQLQQYAHLFNSTSDASFICRQNGEIMLANPAAQRLAGQKPLRKQMLGEWLGGSRSPAEIEAMLAEAAQGRWQSEIELPDPENPDRMLTLALTLEPLFNDAGVANAIAGSATDISERKALETQLRAVNAELGKARDRLLALNSELEQKVAERTRSLSAAKSELERRNAELQTLDQLKSDFVSLVSHELRTPLTSINGGLELLLQNPAMTPDLREDMLLMQQQALRLTQMVTNILNLSALEAGRLQLKVTPLDVGDVLQNFQTTLMPATLAARIHLKLPNSDLPFVYADVSAVRSLLTQLVENADKYAPNSRIEIGAQPMGQWLRVQVSDYGPGVPSDQRERIFERFHRAESNDARETYGYGLGLYTVRLLAQAMQGAVGYYPTIIDDSNPSGAGATFWFTLPIIDLDAADEERA